MCGIAGFVKPYGLDPELATQIGMRMAESIANRGPDDAGVWVDPQSGSTLAHRRLAIMDLSPAGHQPMVS